MTIDHVVGQGAQGRGVAWEMGKVRECFLADFSAERDALLKPDEGRISQFIEGPVASDGFAQLLWCRGLVEDIVGNLKGEPDLLAKDLEVLTLNRIAASEDSADAAACPDQSPGFSGMDGLQMGLITASLLGLDIEDFASDQSQRARGMSESPHTGGYLARVVAATSEDFETEGKEGVSGQNGHRFAELDMARRSPAPQIVVIDCGKIVVDQAEAVNQLNRATCVESSGFCASDGKTARHGKRRAESFTRGQGAVAHGGMEFSRGLGLLGKKLAQSSVDASPRVFKHLLTGHKIQCTSHHFRYGVGMPGVSITAQTIRVRTSNR